MRTQEESGKPNGEVKNKGSAGTNRRGRTADKAVGKGVVPRGTAKKQPERQGGKDRSIASWFNRARQFLKEARIELRKVKWPTRKELIASTTVVLVLVMIISFYLGLIDLGLIKVIKGLVG